MGDSTLIKLNEGHWDRGARLVLGVLLGTLVLTGAVGSTLGDLATVLAVILFATTALGFCPLYALLGVDTRGDDRSGARVAHAGGRGADR